MAKVSAIRIKVENAAMVTLNLTPDKFHGDWNYVIAPVTSNPVTKQPRKLRG